MVYVAPSKGARAGKAAAAKNGNKGNRGRGKSEQEAKADLLAKLTREAEEHTRILERERAALGLPSRVPPSASQPQQQQQQGQHPPAANQRNRRGNYHVYADNGNKKVFDPRQIPGLGGGDGDGGGKPAAQPPEGMDTFNQTFPDSPNFYPGRVFAIPGTIPPPPNQPQQPRPDGGTIVVAPWGGPPQLQYPGGGVMSDMLAGGPLPPQAPQLPGQPPWPQHGQPPSPGARGQQPPMGMGMPPGPRGGTMGQQPPGMGPYPMGPGPGARGGGPMPMDAPPGMGPLGPPPQALGGRPPSGAFPGPPFGVPPMRPALDPAAAADPRVATRMEAEARKEAYRRELEEQIRAKKAAKDAEERRRREEDAAWEARAAAPQPWDPEARAARRGGGGDPIRDEFGRPVANLRQQSGGPGSPHGMGPGSPHGMGPGPLAGMPGPPMGPGMPGPFPGPPGPAGRLTVEVPGGGAGVFPGGGIIPMNPMNGPEGTMVGGPGLGHGPGAPLAPLPLGVLPPPGVPFDVPPGLLSPSNIPPVSPGNRRFMAAMNDLIAGPTDEQRLQKEMARQRLQMDLEEQIREKRERQERERAESERQRLKEEADMKAFQDNLAAQRQAELQRVAAAAGPSQQSPQQPPQQLMRRESSLGGGGDGGRPPLPPRRGKGKIIDASWLDAPKAPPPPPAALPPLSPAPQVSPRPPVFRRASAGILSDELGGGAPLSPAAIMARAPSHGGGVGGGGGAGRGTVTTMLHQLQEEQSRMREDFARQAAAMQKLANDASRALADRDEAWKELHRVKAVLAVGGADAAGDDDDDVSIEILDMGPVIVDTHLLPKTANSIPDPLPKPVASEVLRRGQTDPGQRGGGSGLLGRQRNGGLLSPVARGDGFGGGLYGGGFGYGELGQLQAPMNRGGRRSGIPLPPGLNPPRAAGGGAQLRAPPPRIQSVYGFALDSSPPKSRYNSFFGLDQGDGGSPKHGRIGGGGGGGLPALGPRKPPPLKPPSSPAILRGDHLPSPVKQTRGGPQQQQAGARARSGRPGGVATGPAAERPPRGRAASASPLPYQPKSPTELPPVGPAAAAAAAANGDCSGGGLRQVSRRSLEGMQKLIRRGHEEKLLRGPLGMGSDDVSGSTGTTVLEYVGEEVPQTARSDVDRCRRSREPSLPGHTEMMTPRTAADWAAGSGAVGVAVGGGAVGAGGAGGAKPAARSFYSDSIASYRSLLSNRSGAAATAAAPTTAPDGAMAGDASSPADRSPVTETDGREPTDVAAAAAERGAMSGGGGGGSGSSGGGGLRTGSAVSVAESLMSDIPIQRPVRAGRRLNSSRSSPSADGGVASGSGGGSAAASAGTAIASATAADDS